MKFYLSSYKLGNNPQVLEGMFQKNNKKIGYICNALDNAPKNKKVAVAERDVQSLQNIGLQPEIIDLQQYFTDPSQKKPLPKLSEKLDSLGGIFISGGNTFVLRQAFLLSQLDTWIEKNISSDFIYSGYSAGCCILSPSLKNLQIVDKPNHFPYPQIQNTLWDGLGILPYALLPHYDSDHPESPYIQEEIDLCIQNKTPFVVLKDGEVLYFDLKQYPKNPFSFSKEVI